MNSTMRMKPIFPLILTVALLMGAGRVQTKDGKTFEGEVTFENGAVVVRSPAETRISFDRVTHVITHVRPQPKVVASSRGAKLPDGWKSQDVGRVKYPGSAACDDQGTFTLTASGWGAWGASDSLHFAYRPLKGDGQIIAHVGKLDVSRGPVVAGVMMRQSLAPDAPMVGACLYPSGEVRLPRRPAGSMKDFKPADGPQPAGAAWVRLTRRGEVVTAFGSADGKFWQQVDTHKVPMGDEVLVGVAAWTTGNAWSGSALIDSVTIIPGTPQTTYFPGADPLAQGVMFRDGNAVAGRIVSFDPATGVKYEQEGKQVSCPTEGVARLVFGPVPPEQAAPSSRPGVLLSSGDFVEGDITSVAVKPVDWPRSPQLKVSVRSVLFGVKDFEIARDVIAIDLAAIAPAPAAYEVRRVDGSLVRAKLVSLQSGGARVDGKLMTDIAEIRKL
jgi:hypothetical protein